MKEPNPSDFYLTENDIKLYEQQCEKYKSACDLKYEQHEGLRRKILIFIGVLICVSVLAFIITLAVASEFGVVHIIFIILLLVGISVWFVVTQFGDSIKFPLKSLYISISLSEKIEKYEQAKREYKAYIEQSKKAFWINMDGYRFEREVAKLYEKLGYKANVTSKSADGGIDIILQKGEEKIAVQCKHHSRPVGPNDVRALQGVTFANGYSYGIFVSLNGFTPTVLDEVRRVSDRVKIELVSLPQILHMVELTSNKDAAPTNNKTPSAITSEYKQVTNTFSSSKANQIIESVTIGSTVTVVDLNSNEKDTFKILSYSDFNNNIISNSSPVGIALLHHKKGDIIEVNAPENKYRLKIDEIKN